MRDPGFAWDGSDLSKCSRSGHIDGAGMMKYKAVLQGLLQVATSGFPSHADLRETLVRAHEKHNIFEQSSKSVKDVAAEAADRYRIMARDLYLVKKHGGSVPDALQPLLDLIEVDCTVGSSSSSELGAAAAVAAHSFPDFPEVEAESVESDGSVEVLAVTCRCPSCSKSTCGKQRPPIPNPGIGMQRADSGGAVPVKKKNKKRLTHKQAPSEEEEGEEDHLIKLPVALVHRRKATKKNCPEAYILQNSLKARWVAGQSQKQNVDYLQKIQSLKKLIDRREITTKKAAKEWLSMGT